MSSEWAIEARGLGKRYALFEKPSDRLKQLLWGSWSRREMHREFWAIRDIDLQIAAGEVVGITGRNGAGKSTLLQMLCGTLTPTCGDLKVNGRVAALLELGAGFNPDFTGIENVFINAAILGLKRSETEAKLDDILAFADIGAFIHQPVKTYSSGMFVRLAFAVATSVDPEILVIDEALSVGDGSFARKSFDRIMRLRDAGKTILFCSHSTYQIEALCARAMWIENGSLRMSGAAAQVTYSYNASLASSEAANVGAVQASRCETSGIGQIRKVTAICDGQSGHFLQVRSQQSDLSIEITFVIDPELPAPGLALGFADSLGQTIASVTSVHDKFDLKVDADGNGSARVTFPQIPLLKGDYSVTVFLSTEDALHAYDQVEHCVRFKVTQAGPLQGILALPHRWQQAGD